MAQSEVGKDVSGVNWSRPALVLTSSEQRWEKRVEFCKTRNGGRYSLVEVACTRMPWTCRAFFVCLYHASQPEAMLPAWLRMFLRILPVCANSSCCFFLFFTPPSTRSCQSTYIIVLLIDRKPREKRKAETNPPNPVYSSSKAPDSRSSARADGGEKKR